jgi:DNA-binding NarL/FixJ family response regulator
MPSLGPQPMGGAMLQEAIRLRPDVVVTDVLMPLLNGLDSARRIRKQAPKMRFVFLTMLDDANLAAAALELAEERSDFSRSRRQGSLKD